jgi:hypothetical protein
MSNEYEKLCQKCGAKNQPYAAFCVECGNSFILPPETPPPVSPPPPPSEEPLDEGPLDEEPLYDAPLEPSPRFKKRYLLYAVIAFLALFAVVGVIYGSIQNANTAIATPSIEASSIGVTSASTASSSVTATVTASVTTNATVTTKATSLATSTSSAQSSLPDYTSRLNTVGLGAGLTAASPFEKVTINGKTAYASTLVKNGQNYYTQVYPMNSYSEALAFKSELISSYQSQGYTTYNPGNIGDAGLNIWYGLSGNTLVSVTAMPTSQIDAPLVLVMTPTK